MGLIYLLLINKNMLNETEGIEFNQLFLDRMEEFKEKNGKGNRLEFIKKNYDIFTGTPLSPTYHIMKEIREKTGGKFSSLLEAFEKNSLEFEKNTFSMYVDFLETPEKFDYINPFTLFISFRNLILKDKSIGFEDKQTNTKCSEFINSERGKLGVGPLHLDTSSVRYLFNLLIKLSDRFETVSDMVLFKSDSAPNVRSGEIMMDAEFIRDHIDPKLQVGMETKLFETFPETSYIPSTEYSFPFNDGLPKNSNKCCIFELNIPKGTPIIPLYLFKFIISNSTNKMSILFLNELDSNDEILDVVKFLENEPHVFIHDVSNHLNYRALTNKKSKYCVNEKHKDVLHNSIILLPDIYRVTSNKKDSKMLGTNNKYQVVKLERISDKTKINKKGEKYYAIITEEDVFEYHSGTDYKEMCSIFKLHKEIVFSKSLKGRSRDPNTLLKLYFDPDIINDIDVGKQFGINTPTVIDDDNVSFPAGSHFISRGDHINYVVFM